MRDDGRRQRGEFKTAFFEWAARLKAPFDARTVADAFNISPTDASRRLRKYHGWGALGRAERGKSVYGRGVGAYLYTLTERGQAIAQGKEWVEGQGYVDQADLAANRGRRKT